MDTTEFILEYLLEQGGATKEYDLLNFIEKQHPYFFSHIDNMSLFKKHFFLFNKLYKLNEKLLEAGQCLIISALEIRLCSVADSGNDIGHVDALKSFYLDDSNLHLSESEVSEMMQGFWKKYLALDQKVEAIKILGLQSHVELTKDIIRKRYNQLAKEHHPDKGGDPLEFVKIKQAYEGLKLLY